MVSEGELILEVQALGLSGERIDYLLTSSEVVRLEMSVARRKVEFVALVQLLADPSCLAIAARLEREDGVGQSYLIRFSQARLAESLIC